MSTRTAAPSTSKRRFQRATDADGALLRRAAAGDDHAFESFYHQHADALLGYSQHLLGSRQEAEDVVQQTFFSAYREIAAGNLPVAPKAWLYAIARNRSMSLIRARREQAAELAELPAPALTEEVERRAELRQLVTDLHRLPEEQRSAIVLFELAGLSQADIGDVIGREPEQVKALVYQARNTLMAGKVARETPCERVQEQIAVSRGGQLNSRTLRHHVSGCEDCSRYFEEVRRQRRGLAIILPVAPALAVTAAKGGGAVAAGSQVGRLHHLTKPLGAATGVAAVAAVAAFAVLPGGDDGKGKPRAAAPAAATAAPTAATAATGGGGGSGSAAHHTSHARPHSKPSNTAHVATSAAAPVPPVVSAPVSTPAPAGRALPRKPHPHPAPPSHDSGPQHSFDSGGTPTAVEGPTIVPPVTEPPPVTTPTPTPTAPGEDPGSDHEHHDNGNHNGNHNGHH